MRYLTIPADADTAGMLANNKGEPIAAWPFIAGFFVGFVLPKLPRNTADATEILVALTAKLNDAKPGDVVELTDAEHEALVKALPNGQGDLPGELLMRTAKFFHAVTSAAKEKPAQLAAAVAA